MKFAVNSDQQSINLQNALFGIGYTWLTSKNEPIHVSAPYIFAGSDGSLTYIGYRNDCGTDDQDDGYFKRHHSEEQDIEQFILDNQPKTPHVHSALMIEYALDTSIQIQIQALAGDGNIWIDNDAPSWSPSRKYRKKPVEVYPRYNPEIWGVDKFNPHEVEKILKGFVKSGALENYYRSHGVDGLGKKV